MIKKLLLILILLIPQLSRASIVGVNPALTNDIRNGLVGYWTLDGKDISNGVVKDISGNGNDLNTSGISTTTFYAQGKIGQGFNLDGTDDFAHNTGTIIPSDSDWTTALWVNVPLLPSGTDVVMMGQSTGTTNDIFFYANTTAGTANNQIRLFFRASGGEILTGPALRGTGWRHIVFTRSGTTCSLYVDGKFNTSASCATGTIGSHFRLGAAPNAGDATRFYFNGQLDDARVYNRALSATEISRIYKTTSQKYVSTSFTNSSHPLNSGLLGYWTFDGKDITNGRVNDLSGNGNNGNLVSISTSTFYTAGKIGQGGNFDGVDDYLKTSPTLNFGGTKVITVCYWSKWTFANDDGLAMELSTNYNNNDGTFIIDPNHSTQLKIAVGIQDSVTTAKYRAESFNRPSSGVWHHYCIVFDNSTVTGDITPYVDGTEQATTVYTNTKDQSSAFKTDTLYFMSRAGTSLFGKGGLDDVRIYSRTLSASEVKQLYNLTSQNYIDTSFTNLNSQLNNGLVGYWTFDGKDMSNGVALDKSGNGDNGNLSGVSTSTFYTAGKIGQGLNFDGVDDYIGLGNNSATGALKPSLPVTVSAWIKTTNTGVSKTIFASNDKDGAYAGYTLFILNSGAVFPTFGDNTGVTSSDRRSKTGTTIVTDNKWHHVVGVIRGAGDMDIYVDGVNDGGSYSGTGGAMAYTATESVIGRHTVPGTDAYFNGNIDDVRIYNRALSASEVKQLYNLTKF